MRCQWLMKWALMRLASAYFSLSLKLMFLVELPKLLNLCEIKEKLKRKEGSIYKASIGHLNYHANKKMHLTDFDDHHFCMIFFCDFCEQ